MVVYGIDEVKDPATAAVVAVVAVVFAIGEVKDPAADIGSADNSMLELRCATRHLSRNRTYMSSRHTAVRVGIGLQK